jgi:energy-coupling factor transporter ATP-binding protein EcfA2
MQLAEVEIEGLFGRYHHLIPFPTTGEVDAEASVVILHGPNGIGKTTVLRMLDGMMRLHFSVFRSIPFRFARVRFNDGKELTVSRGKDGVLEVTFEGLKVTLHSQHPGPQSESDNDLVEQFRTSFFNATEALTFEFVGSVRSQPGAGIDHDVRMDPRMGSGSYSTSVFRYLQAKTLEDAVIGRDRESAPVQTSGLAENVKEFIRGAQVDRARTSVHPSLIYLRESLMI